VSPVTRLVANDEKTTSCPLALMPGALHGPSACAPLLSTLTRVVTPLWRSCTKMSATPFVSSAVRSGEVEAKATYRPSALMAALVLSPLAWAPALVTLTRVVVPPWRSRTNTSNLPFVSPSTRFVAEDSNATKPPFSLTEGCWLWESPIEPASLTLTRLVWPV